MCTFLSTGDLVRQAAEDGPFGERFLGRCRRGEGQTRFANAAGAGQAEQAHAGIDQERGQGHDIILPADK
jgi:hypothetical protein